MKIVCPHCKHCFEQKPNDIFCPHCKEIADPDICLKKSLNQMLSGEPAPKKSTSRQEDSGSSRIYSWKRR